MSPVLLPTATGQATRRAVWSAVRPHRRLAVVTFGVLLAGTVVGLLGPPLVGRIVDLVVDGRSPSSITTPAVALLVVAVVQGILVAGGSALVARLGETALAGVRERVVDRALVLPLEQVERAGTGDLLARVGGDVSVVSDAARDALPPLVEAAFTIGLTVVGLAMLDWRFALAGLCAAPVQLLALRWYLRVVSPLYREERVAEGARAQQLLDSIDGARTVRTFGLRAQHTALVAERSQHALEVSMRAATRSLRFYARLNVAELVGLSAILLTGFFLVRADAATVGAATAAALYFQRLFDPINVLLGLFDEAQAATAALARLVGVADLPAAPPPARPDTLDGSVTVDGVRHAYVSGHDVLRGLDLNMRAGEKVALVGTSGAGKSTVAKLVAGVHEPTDGSVRFGTSPDGGRGVTLVTQEVHVFAGTLAEDLRLVRLDATVAELEGALARVGALEWAQRLPDGLDTVVGAGAQELTATQAQQLALARVLLVDPVVVVLDEATAEAGSAGARELEVAAAEVLAGRTGLVVAHRLTQAATADRIFVMEDGRFVESGTHAELVASEGPYAALWAAWSGARPPA